MLASRTTVVSFEGGEGGGGVRAPLKYTVLRVSPIGGRSPSRELTRNEREREKKITVSNINFDV